jgi:hypothetical protein
MANIPLSATNNPYRYNPTTPLVGRSVVTADRSVTWSANNGGLINPATGISTTLTALNRTLSVVVSAVSGADSGAITIQVYGTWPVQPHFGYEVAIDNKTLASPAEDGSMVYRRKGPIRLSWTLGFNNIPATEWELIRDFFNYHQKDIPFYYQDLGLNEDVATLETPILRLVTADSGPKVTVAGPDRYNITIVLRQV